MPDGDLEAPLAEATENMRTLQESLQRAAVEEEEQLEQERESEEATRRLTEIAPEPETLAESLERPELEE